MDKLNKTFVAGESLAANELNEMVAAINDAVDELNTMAGTPTFAGVATPATNPGSPDGPVFYLAAEKGVYTNFSGLSISESDGLVVLLYSSVWEKKNIPVATKPDLAQLEVKILNSRNTVGLKRFIDYTPSSREKILFDIRKGEKISFKFNFSTQNFKFSFALIRQDDTLYTIGNLEAVDNEGSYQLDDYITPADYKGLSLFFSSMAGDGICEAEFFIDLPTAVELKEKVEEIEDRFNNRYRVVNLNKELPVPDGYTPETAKAAIPVDKRERGQLIAYAGKNNQWSLEMNVAKNPTIEAAWMGEHNWVGLISPDKQSIGCVWLPFVEDKKTTRDLLPIVFRKEGMMITYFDTENEETIVELYKGGNFDNDTNWENIKESTGSVGELDPYEVVRVNNLEDVSEYESEAWMKTLSSLMTLDEGLGSIELSVPEDINGITPFALHTSSAKGLPVFNDVFFNGECKTDFSDIKFVDESGNDIPFRIHSFGNYDFVREDNFKDVNVELSDGRIVSSFMGNVDKSVSGTWIRSEESDFTLVSKKTLIGKSFVDDSLFLMDYADYGVYKISQEGSVYSDENAVKVIDLSHTNSRIGFNAFAQNSNGDIFMGKYQGAWSVEVFRSTDNGDTFEVVYASDINQHVHQIYIDKEDTVFVGLDGYKAAWNNDAAKPPRCIKSTDNGETWETLPITFNNRDYGITYHDTEKGFSLGNGETTILGGHTIYKTRDFVNYYPVCNTGQGVRKIKRIGEYLLAGGQASHNNRVAQVYLSQDDGETWITAYATPFVPTSSPGDFNRFLSEVQGSIVFGTQHFYALNTDIYNNPVRFIPGGDNHFALCFLDIPKNTTKIYAKYGCKIIYPKLKHHDVILNGCVFKALLNEGIGDRVKEQISGKRLKIEGSWSHDKATHQYNFISPANLPIQRVNSVTSLAIDTKLPDFETNELTFIFWANFSKSKSVDKLLFGDPEGFRIHASNYRIKVSNGENELASDPTFYAFMGTDIYLMCSVAISEESIKIYLNDYETCNTNISGIQMQMSNKYIGNVSGDLNDLSDLGISNISVYDRALSEEEIRLIYNGAISTI